MLSPPCINTIITSCFFVAWLGHLSFFVAVMLCTASFPYLSLQTVDHYTSSIGIPHGFQKKGATRYKIKRGRKKEEYPSDDHLLDDHHILWHLLLFLVAKLPLYYLSDDHLLDQSCWMCSYH